MDSNHVAIQTQGLSRVYKTYKKPEGFLNSVKGFWSREYISKEALKPTDLKVEKGQMIGLVGANGAGKTTLLKLLSGLIHPSAGSAKILGHNPWDREVDFLKKISILLGQKNQLWWDLPPMDSFRLLMKIYDVDPVQTRQRVMELADVLNCRDLLQIQLRRLSLGERMKMEIIGALLHRPQVIFLDEPTIGLDVVAQSSIREFLNHYVERENPTVILTSHYMDDISHLADRLLLLSKGAIVYDGPVESFAQTVDKKQKLTLKLETPADADIFFKEQKLLARGEDLAALDVKASDLGAVIGTVASKNTIQNIKIEEEDFEEVIRQFLEKESR